MYTSKINRAKRRELSKAFSAVVKNESFGAWICTAINHLKDQKLKEDAEKAVQHTLGGIDPFLPQALFGSGIAPKNRLKIRRQWVRLYVEKGVAFSRYENHPYVL